MSTCQILARWPGHHGMHAYVPPETMEASNQASAWEGEPAIPERFDDVTEAAFAARAAEGLGLLFRPAGIAWPDRLPFRVDHLGEPITELRVDYDGQEFTAIGEISEADATRLSGIWHVSDTLHPRRARIVDVGSQRFVEVTESELVELTATAQPAIAGTSLMVGKPGSRWIPEATIARFARLESPDSLRLAFPGNVEVI